MPRLAISLLGAMQVKLDDRPLPAIGTTKARALLAYLMLEAERPLGREWLASLFWPDYQAARTNLRQALYQLRRAIAEQNNATPHLLVTDSDVQFNQASDYWLDVSAFDALIDETRINHRGGVAHRTACFNRLESAMALYRGELLAGLTLPDCQQFEWWLLERQEHCHGRALEVVQQLAGHYEQVEDYSQAAIWARKEVELESWSQSAHRRLMRLLAIGGQRRAALGHYDHLRQMLLQETGSPPSDRTTRLYQQIKAGSPDYGDGGTGSPVYAVASSVVAQSTASTSFAGFEKELAWLDARLAQAAAGRGQIVFVTGEAGSGKSTLSGEFARRAIRAHPGLLIIAGSCDAHAGPGIPYLPVREALHQLVDRTRIERLGRFAGRKSAERLRAAQNDVIPALVQKAPSLLQLFLPRAELIQLIRETGDHDCDLQASLELVDATQPAGIDAQRVQPSVLFDQVVDFLFALSEGHSLLLILDDLQWADRGTINLLFHLGRRLTGSRVLLVGAYRPETVAAGPPAHLAKFMDRHPLRPVVFELQQQFGDNRLDLDSSDGLAFVHAYLDREPNWLDDTFRQALYQHTLGNPLFVVELLRQLEERGQLTRDGQGHLITDQEVDWTKPPPKVESVIGERIDQLPDSVRLALEAASVQGQEFVAEVVEIALSLKHLGHDWAGEIASRQHRLVEAKSMRRIGGQRLSRYEFHHFLIQQYLYQRLDQIQRAWMHEATGQALESLCAEQAEDYASQLGRHFEAAGVWDKAAEYLVLAGKQAYLLSANEEAISFFQRGISLLEQGPPGEQRDQLEMCLQLAQTAPLLAVGGYVAPGIREVVERIIRLAQRLAEPEHIFPARILLLVNHTMLAEYDQARQLVDLLMEQACREQHPLHLMQAHHFAGHLQLCTGSFNEALCHFDSALAANDPQFRSFLASGFIGGNIWITSLIRKAWALWFLGYPDQSSAALNEALSQVEQAGRAHDLAFALGLGICPILYVRRDFEQAETQARRLLRLAAEKDLYYFVPFAQVILGAVLAKDEPNAKGLDMLRAGLKLYRRSGQRALLSFCLSLLAEALDGLEETVQVLDEAADFVGETGERFYKVELYRLRGDFLAKQAADLHWVERCYWRAISGARQQRARSLELRATISLARFWQELGQVLEARQLLAESYGWFTEGFQTADLREARALLQELETELSAVGLA